MKLTKHQIIEQMKETIRQIIRESEKEPAYTKGKKRIVITCNDSTGDFEKFLNWWKSMGNIGHSAVVHCDVEQSADIVKIFCDGDGSDKIYSIDVENMPDE